MPTPTTTRASAGVESAAVATVAAPAIIAAPSASFVNFFIPGLLRFSAFPSIADILGRRG